MPCGSGRRPGRAIGPTTTTTTTTMYDIRTKHGDTEVTAENYNVGSDGFLHAKNGSTTVASIPIGNLEGVFRR